MTTNTMYAPHIRRLAAAAIDSVIVSLIGLLISSALNTDPYSNQTTFANTIDNVLTLCMAVFYYVGFWSMRNGQTPGKQLMHLRVVREDGKKMDIFTGIIRVVGQSLSGLFLGLGYLWILFDKKRQGWHDKLAHTVVVVADNEKPHGCLTAMGCIVPVIVFISMLTYGILKTSGALSKITDGIATVTKKKQTIDYASKLTPEAKTIVDAANARGMQIGKEKDSAKILELNNTSITELTKATTMDPTNPIVWEALSTAYTWPTTVGTIEKEGIQAAQKAVDLQETTGNYATLGSLYYRVKKYDEAVTTLKQAIRLSDVNPEAHFWLARAYAKLQIYDTARTEYQRAIDIFTNHNGNGVYDETILMLQKENANLPK